MTARFPLGVYHVSTIKVPNVFLRDGSSDIHGAGGLRIGVTSHVAAGWNIYPTTYRYHTFTGRNQEWHGRCSRSLRDPAAWITSPKRSGLRGTSAPVVL
jgi:hypothetical protein